VDPRQRVGRIRGADGVADLDRIDACDHCEVARERVVEFDAGEATRAEQLGNPEGLGHARLRHPRHHRATFEPTARDPPDHESTDEVVIVERHGVELQRTVDIDVRRGRVLDDRFEQRP